MNVHVLYVLEDKTSIKQYFLFLHTPYAMRKSKFPSVCLSGCTYVDFRCGLSKELADLNKI